MKFRLFCDGHDTSWRIIEQIESIESHPRLRETMLKNLSFVLSLSAVLSVGAGASDDISSAIREEMKSAMIAQTERGFPSSLATSLQMA